MTSPASRLAYAPAEAAQLVDMSRSQLYKYIADGSIPSIKIGRCRRIRREALIAFLDAHEETDLDAS